MAWGKPAQMAGASTLVSTVCSVDHMVISLRHYANFDVRVNYVQANYTHTNCVRVNCA